MRQSEHRSAGFCSALHCTPRFVHGADNVAGAAQGLLPQRVHASVCGVNNGATSRAGGERVNGCSPAGNCAWKLFGAAV